MAWIVPPHPWPDCRVRVVCWQLDKIEGVFERPSDEVIRALSRALRQALGVSLFGIDIIINNQTGQHAVIDINAFPGERWSGASVPGQVMGQAPPLSVCGTWDKCSPHQVTGLQLWGGAKEVCTCSQGARGLGLHETRVPSPCSPNPVPGASAFVGPISADP